MNRYTLKTEIIPVEHYVNTFVYLMLNIFKQKP